MRWYLLVAVLLASGYLIGPWVLCRIARRWGSDEIQIAKPVQKFGIAKPAEVEAIRLRAEARRLRALASRSESLRIDAGDPQDDRISKIHLVR